MNYPIEIKFDDGIKWLARIRRFDATSPPPGLRDYIIQNEVATLRFLEQTGAPSPKVFGFALENEDNPMGCGYMLLKKWSGKSLRWSLVVPEQRRKVMSQPANTFIELRKFPSTYLAPWIGQGMFTSGHSLENR
ncbi:MAG: kinase-like domain-containing protein [Lasallia pustulata]|uniref:Kinase-like domain-containing protein n=1 Tax=Lasallia pustulata TaxID=136370 RepID=A0A5M8PWK7_9LECA|nr:MAG: kinase-like domain-containing protein [Lasallia pustulata]